MNEQERAIFASAHNDYDIAFAKLFQLYGDDVYRAVIGAAFYRTEVAEQIVQDIFTTAYKYLHTFSSKQGSFRLYLQGLAAQQLLLRTDRVPPTTEQLPKKLKHRLSAEQVKLWLAIEQLPTMEWLVTELWHGAKLSTSELALVLEKPVHEIQALQKQANVLLQQRQPQFIESIEPFYTRRNAFATLSNSQKTKLLRSLLERKRLRLTFVQQGFWQRIFKPATILTVLVVGCVAVGTLGAVMFREEVRSYVTQSKAISTTTNPVSDLFDSVITKQRPSFLFKSGQLPDVEVTRQSLVETTDIVYGSNYVAEHTFAENTEALKPIFTNEIQVDQYIPVESAHTYVLPEALTEDQLQYAALRHFSSLPLNQFAYVNGTYYVEEDPSQFRPLFIAFNNTGGIDLQMRQAAICQLPNLTAAIADNQAQSTGFEFLQSHHFVEAEETDLSIERISSEGRTVAKDAFCQDGDQAQVQDRLFVYYPPHTLLSYADGAESQLALRLRGIAVQMHGEQVTNLRVDPLYLLLQYITPGEDVAIRPLSQAVELLQAYSYPSDADLAATTRSALVFPQWNRSHGTDRIKTYTISSVRLEYVYDELRHTIEPYYVFSGLGVDGNDKTIESRWYVVASTTIAELRSPYRE